jgi:hypothetical protein
MHKLPLTGKAEFSVDRATPSPKANSEGRSVKMRQLPQATFVIRNDKEIRSVFVESGTPAEFELDGQKFTVDLIGMSMGQILS